MKKINIVILDDEFYDAHLLGEICNKYFSSKKLLYNCIVMTEAKKLLNYDLKEIDFILLDIDMADYSGIELAERLKRVNKRCFVCFVTKYPNYIFESQHIHAFDYILKPIQQNQIIQVFDDFTEQLNTKSTLLNKIIQFDTTDGTALLECNEIISFEYFEHFIFNTKIFNRSTKINTTNRTYLIKHNIKSIYKLLPNELFIIPHQSYIINMNHIKLLKSTEIVMSDGSSIPISQKRLSETKRSIIHYFRTMKGEH